MEKAGRAAFARLLDFEIGVLLTRRQYNVVVPTIFLFCTPLPMTIPQIVNSFFKGTYNLASRTREFP